MMDTDAVRKEFAEAYKAYVAEGYRMRELLLERRLNEDSDSRAIVEQQKRVNKVRSSEPPVRFSGSGRFSP
jgi:hypothetical protein